MSTSKSKYRQARQGASGDVTEAKFKKLNTESAPQFSEISRCDEGAF